VETQAHQVRQLIGLTGQYASVDEMLTGTENLVLLARLTGQTRTTAKQRAKDLLRQFNLEDAAARAVKTYSGGMRRRLDLAASLVAHPRVLFLDEPTTGLDPRSRNDMWNVVRDLTTSHGVTVLLTTHFGLTTPRREGLPASALNRAAPIMTKGAADGQPRAYLQVASPH
jgi:oleandomycin transport system ATP-binding protein